MEKSKKRHLLGFLTIYLTVEAIFFLSYIYHSVSGGPPEQILHDVMVRDLSLKLLIVVGILAPIMFLVIWNYIYRKK